MICDLMKEICVGKIDAWNVECCVRLFCEMIDDIAMIVIRPDFDSFNSRYFFCDSQKFRSMRGCVGIRPHHKIEGMNHFMK